MRGALKLAPVCRQPCCLWKIWAGCTTGRRWWPTMTACARRSWPGSRAPRYRTAVFLGGVGRIRNRIRIIFGDPERDPPDFEALQTDLHEKWEKLINLRFIVMFQLDRVGWPWALCAIWFIVQVLPHSYLPTRKYLHKFSIFSPFLKNLSGHLQIIPVQEPAK